MFLYQLSSTFFLVKKIKCIFFRIDGDAVFIIKECGKRENQLVDELHGAAPGTGRQRHLAGHFVITRF